MTFLARAVAKAPSARGVSGHLCVCWPYYASDARHVVSRPARPRCLEGMTEHNATTQGRRHRRRIRRNTGGQPSADARRRRHHPGQPAPEVRRADPAAPVRGRHRRRHRRLRHAARRGHPTGRRHAPPASTPPPAQCSWPRARRWTTTTSSTRSAAPARRRRRCPARPNSPIPSPNWSYAQRLRAALDELHPDAPITVVGAGLTGIETAAELAEQGRIVTLVCGGNWLRRCLSPAGGRSPSGWRRHGVDVLEADGGDRGPPGCGSARRRRRAAQRGDDLDGRVRRAGPGGRAAGCAPTRWAGCSPTRR